MLNIDVLRGVAQSGSVFALEARGHRFKSCHPDQMTNEERKVLEGILNDWDDSAIFDWADSTFWTIEKLLEGKGEEDARSPSPLELYAAEEVAKKEND